MEENTVDRYRNKNIFVGFLLHHPFLSYSRVNMLRKQKTFDRDPFHCICQTLVGQTRRFKLNGMSHFGGLGLQILQNGALWKWYYAPFWRKSKESHNHKIRSSKSPSRAHSHPRLLLHSQKSYWVAVQSAYFSQGGKQMRRWVTSAVTGSKLSPTRTSGTCWTVILSCNYNLHQ